MTAGPARPLVVVWRVTEACDLSCWYCEYNRHLRRPRRGAQAEAVLAFGKLLAGYAAQAGRSVLVSWLGGEPLLWPPLVKVSRALCHEYGLRLGLTTNGERLREAGLIQHLAETYAEVTISVDGLAGFHDTARGTPGLFDRLRAAVGELREHAARRAYGPLLRANTILMRSNLQAFEPLCETLASWGIQAVTFNALGGQPPGPHYLRERLGPTDVEWLRSALPGIRQRLAPLGLVVQGSEGYLQRLAAGARDQKLPVVDCHPGAEFLFVDEQGRAAPCSFTAAGYGVPIADIRSSAELAGLPMVFGERRRAARLPPCYDCQSTQVLGKFDLENA